MIDPLITFQKWHADAARHGVQEPGAMALATVNPEGFPEVRMVLLKHADEHGFVFYTNLDSPKAVALRAHPRAELCFYWNPPGRQVRVSGLVKAVTDDDGASSFASRTYLCRIGAWACKQSKPLRGSELERAVAATMLRHPRGRVPRPPHWSGFRVVPDRIELWSEKPFRMHDRELFTRTAPDAPWSHVMLQP